jgi:hypothetical protein
MLFPEAKADWLVAIRACTDDGAVNAAAKLAAQYTRPELDNLTVARTDAFVADTDMDSIAGAGKYTPYSIPVARIRPPDTALSQLLLHGDNAVQTAFSVATFMKGDPPQ